MAAATCVQKSAVASPELVQAHEHPPRCTDEQLREAIAKLDRTIEEIPPRTLDQYLRLLIAEEDGVRPEQVTVEYIHEQREKFLYPITRYNIGGRYGGYVGVGMTPSSSVQDRLRFFTREELGALAQSVDARMAKF